MIRRFLGFSGGDRQGDDDDDAAAATSAQENLSISGALAPTATVSSYRIHDASKCATHRHVWHTGPTQFQRGVHVEHDAVEGTFTGLPRAWRHALPQEVPFLIVFCTCMCAVCECAWLACSVCVFVDHVYVYAYSQIAHTYAKFLTHTYTHTHTQTRAHTNVNAHTQTHTHAFHTFQRECEHTCACVSYAGVFARHLPQGVICDAHLEKLCHVSAGSGRWLQKYQSLPLRHTRRLWKATAASETVVS